MPNAKPYIPEYYTKIKGGGNSRCSNLELLRIVSMLLVLLIHFVPHHCIPSPESLSSETGTTIINLCLKSLSFICVNCFILISGYFGIRWKIKSFLNLLFQILFWIFFGVGIAYLLDIGFEGNTTEALIGFINARWFIPAYLALYIIAPVLNAFTENCSSTELLRYLLIFYLFSTIFGYFLLSSEFNEGMSLISLIGIYLTGAYLKRDDSVFKQFNAKTSLLSYFLCGLALLIASLCLYSIGINKSIYGYLNPVVIMQSVFLFLFFKNLKISFNPVINFIAASAFSIYLFHMHPMIISTYGKCCKYLAENTWAILTVPAFFISLFAFCVVVDRFRILIFQSSYNLVRHEDTAGA